MPAGGDREGLSLKGSERLLVQHILQKAAQCLCFKHISTNFAKDRQHQLAIGSTFIAFGLHHLVNEKRHFSARCKRLTIDG